MTVRIVTDSTCDLPQSVIDDLGIVVIPLYINIGDKSFLDGVDISRQEFYTNLWDYPAHPTTATPSLEVFTRTYQALALEGATEILSIHISLNLSATVDVARTTAQVFQDIPVTVLDSGQLSLGTGFQVELAARLARQGKALTEILAALEDLAARTFVSAHLDTLEFLRRSGRMNKVLNGLASLISIKPILKMKSGEPASEMVRTSRKAENRLIQLIEAHRPVERFALLHTNAPDKAQAFRQRLHGVVEHIEDFSMGITPVIGAHIGPGALGFALISEKRDE
jgi:DegV family protein with EDD domain